MVFIKPDSAMVHTIAIWMGGNLAWGPLDALFPAQSFLPLKFQCAFQPFLPSDKHTNDDIITCELIVKEV